MNRRKFMGGLAAIPLAGAVSASPAALFKTEKHQTRPGFRPIGRPSQLQPFGMGGVAVGNGMATHTETEAYNALQGAWDAGVRYFDTSPRYGNGLSERRMGAFLFDKPRQDYVLSSKIGRILYADKDYRYPEDSFWQGIPHQNYYYDFSASGVRRAIEDSLTRMGQPYLDFVFVHDIDSRNKDIDWKVAIRECTKGAFPELSRMRREGIIRGWGLGVNEVEPVLMTLDVADPNITLLAQQYSLIKHESALKKVFPKAARQNMDLVLGGILETGFLAGKDRYAYQPKKVTPELLNKRRALEQVCQQHGVDLRTAAIQFGYGSPQVKSVLVGASSAEQNRQNVRSLTTSIPDAFWRELKSKGLIHADAPVPPSNLNRIATI